MRSKDAQETISANVLKAWFRIPFRPEFLQVLISQMKSQDLGTRKNILRNSDHRDTSPLNPENNLEGQTHMLVEFNNNNNNNNNNLFTYNAQVSIYIFTCAELNSLKKT